METINDYAAEIKATRLRLGLTQKQLGRAAGVSDSLISYVEGRHKPVSPQTRRRLTIALNSIATAFVAIEDKTKNGEAAIDELTLAVGIRKGLRDVVRQALIDRLERVASDAIEVAIADAIGAVALETEAK